MCLVLRALGANVALPRAVLLYTSVDFANSVAPFGHLGAEPLAALFLSRATDAEYGTSLAAVAGVELFVVPLSMLAIVIPLPGGAGGVEASIALLRVSLAGLSPVGDRRGLPPPRGDVGPAGAPRRRRDAVTGARSDSGGVEYSSVWNR